MAVSPARAVAFEILLRIERDDSYATELLHSAALRELSSRDHGLATELVMGVLRWRSLLDARLAVASSQKLNRLDAEVLTALRLGIYQLHFLTRVPAHAAIFESVELVKATRKSSAAPFVNAVLRKITRTNHKDHKEGDTSASIAESTINESPDAATLAKRSAHPLWMVARWADRCGIESARKICAYDQTIPTTAIHIRDERTAAELVDSGIHLAPGRLLSTARRVVSGDVVSGDNVSGNVIETRAYREGRVSIQDEASQLVALLAGQRGSQPDSPILDCCAAPGSKTALIAERNLRAQVFATELHPHRARLLQSLNRLPNVRVIAADAQRPPFVARFDRILADVPCSGTGTLARNPEIKWRLKSEDLSDLQSRQIAILKSGLERLAVRGRLVYSTCSLEYEENEAVVEAAIAGSKEFKVGDLRNELEELRREGEFSAELVLASLLSGPYLRTIPGVHPCDGFFAAVIERV
ncbi:MAG TPA: transcription antitermination factor NusB [Terriglobales bacterium]|nr:transcription antitermination factor NusB [Terriglobales bacterium]